MKAILFVLLGLCLGTGTTLIFLQERFLRERRRLLALGESQRAKGEQASEELTRKWEEECELLRQELQGCQVRLAERVESAAVPPPEDRPEMIDRHEHQRLIEEKNGELSRLAGENKSLADQCLAHQREIDDLNLQISYLKDELVKAQAARNTLPDDDFLLLGGQAANHLLPGSVARAFIRGNPRFPRP